MVWGQISNFYLQKLAEIKTWIKERKNECFRQLWLLSNEWSLSSLESLPWSFPSSRRLVQRLRSSFLQLENRKLESITRKVFFDKMKKQRMLFAVGIKLCVANWERESQHISRMRLHCIQLTVFFVILLAFGVSIVLFGKMTDYERKRPSLELVDRISWF